MKRDNFFESPLKGIPLDKQIQNPNSIIGGNPAKMIRMRFSDNQIKQLLEMEWWNWSEDRLASAMNLLCSEDIDKLYEYWLTTK